MFTGILTSHTFRWLLDLLGFALLMAACVLHSWTLDGIGLVFLIAATLLDPPFSGFGGKVRSFKAWFAATFLFLFFDPFDGEEVGDTAGARPKRPDWDLADSAYVQRIIQENDQQLAFKFDFPAAALPPVYERCIYSVTPCGRPTHVRAWGDLH
jgi:hypothetical protein